MPTLTVDFTAPQAVRIAAALGKERNLVDANGDPRSVTMAEYRAWIIDVTKRMVMGTEHREEVARVPAPTNLDVA